MQLSVKSIEKKETEMSKCFVGRLWKNMKKHPMLYAMALPVVIYYVVFKYFPMYGLLIAFQNFKPALGLFESEWVGFQNFTDFFSNREFFRLIRNTFVLNFYNLLFGFPLPIIFALLLNEIKGSRFKKTVQTVTYMPHFISAMVVCGLVSTFLRSDGVITYILTLFGAEAKNYLGEADAFRTIFTSMNVWQEFGWGSIIYFASLSSIDPTLYEAASIDGANRFKKVLHITLPGLAPTIVTLLILRMGNMMTLGFEKIILLYSPLTYETADVISSYVYRQGLQQYNYSYGAAVGLFNSIINLIFLIGANCINRKINNSSLW